MVLPYIAVRKLTPCCGEQDNLMQDTPDELRPPSLVLFHGFETCPNAESQLRFRLLGETKLPSRERLMMATYDMVSYLAIFTHAFSLQWMKSRI
jgi:hypothetical protein